MRHYRSFADFILALMSSLAIMSTIRNGLVNFHSIFASYPLIILALSAPLLSEHVSWRQWIVVIVGFIGVILILRPDTNLVNSGSILAISAAVLMAIYGILTRFASKTDDAYTSLFWAATVGGSAMLFLLVFYFDLPKGSDWFWMGALCLVGAFGHFFIDQSFYQQLKPPLSSHLLIYNYFLHLQSVFFSLRTSLTS